MAETAPASTAQRLAARQDAKLPQRWSRPVISLAEEIVTLSRLPRLSWGFAELDRLAPFVAGTMSVLLGPTGRGKSALAFQIARHHAEKTGPVLVVSAELTGAIAGARMVSQHSGLSWLNVMSGELEVELMREALDVPRMFLADEVGRNALERLDQELAVLRRDFPDDPPLAVVDYIQLISAEGQVDPRVRVESVAVALRKLAVKHRCGVLALSKAGRGAARALRSGESVGSDATEAAAESGAVEHEAAVLLALGEAKPDPEDAGIVIVDLSVAKARFGAGGDQIVPLRWRGSSGAFAGGGDAVKVADRKAAAAAIRDAAKVDAAKVSIVAFLRRAGEPLTRTQLREQMGGARTEVLTAAIAELLQEEPCPIAFVKGKKRGGSWPLWTPERAVAAGVELVPQSVVDTDRGSK